MDQAPEVCLPQGLSFYVPVDLFLAMEGYRCQGYHPFSGERTRAEVWVLHVHQPRGLTSYPCRGCMRSDTRLAES